MRSDARKRDHIDLAVDALGNHYTTHCFAGPNDPWQGATILTDKVVTSLRDRGLWPLTPVPEINQTAAALAPIVPLAESADRQFGSAQSITRDALWAAIRAARGDQA